MRSLVLLALLALPAAARADGVWNLKLAETVGKLSAKFKGRIAVYVVDHALGIRAGYDYETPSYLASGVKITFMVEAFRQIHAGTLTLDDEVVYDEQAIRDGAPKLNQRPLGSKLKLRELLELMIKDSDNSASDMILSRIGVDNVNTGMRKLGFIGFTTLTHLIDVRKGTLREVDVAADDLTPTEIRAFRWVNGWDAQASKLCEMIGRPVGTYRGDDLKAGFDRFYKLELNSARLPTVAAVLEQISERTLISKEASEQMFALMSNTRTSRTRILGKLPAGTPVAHKTGSQWERICDLGIIGLPDKHELVFTACLSGGNDRALAEATLADLARAAYDLAVAAHKGHAVSVR